MIPNIPVPVWQQISVVIVFAFLLGGLGWGLTRVFIHGITQVNAHYAALLKENNHRWQQYFDARSETSRLIETQLITRMDAIADLLAELVRDVDHIKRSRDPLHSHTNQPQENNNDILE